MEEKFTKMTNKTFAVIFALFFVMTLLGIIFNQAWWHIYTLLGSGILSVEFWGESLDDDEQKTTQKDNSPI